MLRYVRILRARLSFAISLSAQYRWDFFIDAVMSVVWTVVGLVPIWVAFGEASLVRGWSYGEILLVVGWFTALKGLFGSIFFPSLLELAMRVRDGTLDFLLTKPADTLFLLSTSRFELWRLLDFVGGVILIGLGFAKIGYVPSVLDVVGSLFLVISGSVALYSITVLVGCLAFFTARLEGLPYVFTSFLDFGRWPVTMFQGAARILFTWILPLGILTTYPALAVLGRLELSTALVSVAGFLFLFGMARFLFLRAVGRYTSASS